MNTFEPGTEFATRCAAAGRWIQRNQAQAACPNRSRVNTLVPGFEVFKRGGGLAPVLRGLTPMFTDPEQPPVAARPKYPPGMSSITASRTDPWHCRACGARADLANRSPAVGLVRLATAGPGGFRLGSDGIEPEIEPLLEPCGCGGRFTPGSGTGERSAVEFHPELLRPLAERGWRVLEESDDPRLAALRDVWRPHALVACGRADELGREEQLRIKLEGRLAGLLEDVASARERGDEDAADAAQARYVELGTTYMRRFVVRGGDG